MRPSRPSYQVLLTFMPGAEPWLRVEHSWGAFKLPLVSSTEELWRGIVEHWSGARKHAQMAPPTVRITLEEWQLAKPSVDAARRGQADGGQRR